LIKASARVRPIRAAAPGPALISADDCKVRAGEHFAEIRVHRNLGILKDAEFVWWTEAASARPGVDYVQQGRVTQSFPRGKSSTSFFIRLLPNAARTESQVFYVEIAKARGGSPGGPATRAVISLPGTAAQSS
jgi:hypothetical protein